MTTDSLRVTDEQSKAVQKTPNRVSLDDIEAAIVGEYFMNGTHVLPDAMPDTNDSRICEHTLRVMTVCFLVVQNGFVVIGKAAPADPANYDRAVGEKFAREDAIRQLWPLMGYALRDKLMAEDMAA